MLFDIQTDSSIPIYEQIIAQVIFGIASGDGEPGATMLSVREQANRLLVNPNTVARAYQELERTGILESKRGKGMDITADAPRLCRARRQHILSQRIREVLREAVSSGLPADAIRQLVEQELQRLTRENSR